MSLSYSLCTAEACYSLSADEDSQPSAKPSTRAEDHDQARSTQRPSASSMTRAFSRGALVTAALRMAPCIDPGQELRQPGHALQHRLCAGDMPRKSSHRPRARPVHALQHQHCRCHEEAGRPSERMPGITMPAQPGPASNCHAPQSLEYLCIERPSLCHSGGVAATTASALAQQGNATLVCIWMHWRLHEPRSCHLSSALQDWGAVI